MKDKLVFAMPEWPVVPVLGGDQAYPVRRIFCVGRNYADHAREMGMQLNRDAPFYFTKSPTTLISSGSRIKYPLGTENYHYEIELVVALGSSIVQATPAQAEAAIYGFAVGLDMTRRDLQMTARDRGLPWDLGKDFEQSAVIAPITRRQEIEGYDRRIWLTANGDTRQESNLTQLVWPVPDVLSHLSRFYHLGAGDVIFTGTPAGVGAVGTGTLIRGGIDGLADIELTIA
jgi:fumarylpyruvate hydrolase